jgi:hypothetical protein
MLAASENTAVHRKASEIADDDTSVDTSTGSSSTTTDAEYVPLELFDYEIAKWLANSELKKQQKGVDEEMARHDRLQVLSRATAFGALSDYVIGGATLQRENQSLLIDEYWSPVSIDVKYRGLNKAQIRGVLVLQNAFRTWIILKRYREALKSKSSPGTRSFGDEKSIATALYIQSSVRRVIAQKAVETKIMENIARDKAFAKFCLTLKTGVMVTMYSRKYGTSPSRKLSLDDSLTHLTFSASFGSKGKVELKSIHKVHTGISETMYPHSRQPQLSRCICLECLGERVMDLELNTAKQTREMYQGFDRLILLLSGTKSPFFIDNFGIPRRAGPSIIENAITEATLDDEDLSAQMFRSKPDEMRFWAALRTLQEEYDGWQAEQDGERRRYVLDKDTEEETNVNRLRTTQSEQVKKDAFGAAHKVTKFVRFIDESGVSRLIEPGKIKGDVMDSRPAISESGAITPDETRSRDEREGRSYAEEQDTPRKWLNPFRMRGFSTTSKKGTSVSGEEVGQAPVQIPSRSTLSELFGEVDDSNIDAKVSVISSSKGDDESSEVSSFLSRPTGSEASTQNHFSIASTHVTQESAASTSKRSKSSSTSVKRNKEMAISELEDVTEPVNMNTGSAAGRAAPVPRETARSTTGSSVLSACSPSGSSVKSESPVEEVPVTAAPKPFWRTLFCMGPAQLDVGDDDYYIRTGADKANAEQSDVESYYSNYDNRSNTTRGPSSVGDASTIADTLDGRLFDNEDEDEEQEEEEEEDESDDESVESSSDEDAQSEDAIADEGSSDGFAEDD